MMLDYEFLPNDRQIALDILERVKRIEKKIDGEADEHTSKKFVLTIEAFGKKKSVGFALFKDDYTREEKEQILNNCLAIVLHKYMELLPKESDEQ